MCEVHKPEEIEKTEEREGKLIYKEGKIEVREFRDGESHNLWIGKDYFFLDRGCLQQFAERTPIEFLRSNLANYNQSFPYILDKEKVSPEGLALILARARARELNDEVHYFLDKIRK